MPGIQRKCKVLWLGLSVVMWMTNFFGCCYPVKHSSHAFAQFQNLDASVKQAVIVRNSSKGYQKGVLTKWQRLDGNWISIDSPIEVVLGKNGFAPIGEKQEGDGRTPSGIYHLGTAFGYGSSADTKLKYHQATESDFWVDDSQSPQYNQWVSGKPEAKSFEYLKRSDDLYKYGIVIEYNTDPIVPGKGSAIFIHIWRGPGQPTSGCVALSESHLIRLLHWLDQSLNPVIILN